MPTECACCTGKSDDVFSIRLKRMRLNDGTLPALAIGVLSTASETLAWQFPGCKTCCQHVRSYAVVRLLAGIVAIAAFATLVSNLDSLRGKVEGGYLAIAFLAVPLASFVLAKVLFKKFLVVTSPGCAGCSMPITVESAFIGPGVRFRIRHDAWGQKLIALNASTVAREPDHVAASIHSDSPQETQHAVQPHVESPGVWRRGDMLVMQRLAILPDRCVKTNQPADHKVKYSLAWHPPEVYLTILLSPVIYLLVALAARRIAVISIGLSAEQHRRRVHNTRTACGLLLLGFGLIIGCVIAMVRGRADVFVVGLILGVAISVIAASWGIRVWRVLRAGKIDKDFLYINGVCPDYLAQLPPC